MLTELYELIREAERIAYAPPPVHASKTGRSTNYPPKSVTETKALNPSCMKVRRSLTHAAKKWDRAISQLESACFDLRESLTEWEGAERTFYDRED